MAVTPSILITGSSSGAGTAGQSKTDCTAAETITLSDSANASGAYSWELWTSTGSSATLTGANTATPTFTAAADESYVAFCTVDGVKSYSVNASGERISDQGGIAVLNAGERCLVPGETDQFGGWDTPIDNMLADYRAGSLGGGGGGAITGPGSSTDNALVRWNGTAGTALQNGATTEDDSGNVTVNGNIAVTGTVDGRDVATDGTKLDGIESAATADQTGAEIKTAYELEADTNAYDDAAVSKLAGIEASADVTDATNVAAAGALMADGSATLTGNLTVSGSITIDGRDVGVDGTKLDGIEAAADVTDATNVAAATAVMDADFSASSGLMRKTSAGVYEATDTVGAGVGTDVTTVTDGATLTIDCSLGNVFTVTIAGNRTVAAPTNARDGQVIQFLITQDATGSRTLTWNATFNWPGGTAPTLSTAGSSVDIVSAVYNGTEWFATSALAFA